MILTLFDHFSQTHLHLHTFLFDSPYSILSHHSLIVHVHLHHRPSSFRALRKNRNVHQCQSFDVKQSIKHSPLVHSFHHHHHHQQQHQQQISSILLVYPPRRHHRMYHFLRSLSSIFLLLHHRRRHHRHRVIHHCWWRMCWMHMNQ